MPDPSPAPTKVVSPPAAIRLTLETLDLEADWFGKLEGSYQAQDGHQLTQFLECRGGEYGRYTDDLGKLGISRESLNQRGGGGCAAAYGGGVQGLVVRLYPIGLLPFQ